MSLKRYLSASGWALEPSPSSLTPANHARWSNKDMDPVPPHERTWTTMSYVAYWISDAANVAVWQLASSMIAVGLSWGQALLAIAIGHIIIAVVMVLNGTIGARLHIAFPVLNRSSFGFWFSYFSVISRTVLAMFWFGIQTYTGSECVYQMLKAIWPSTGRIPNHLPEDANITTVVKAFIVPLAFLIILIWAMVKAPPSVSLNQQTSISGGDFSWAWLSALNSALGIYATLSVNIPDFTRYAKNERAQYVQLAIIPTAFTLIAFVGIAVTSAGQVLYQDTLWDPTKFIDRAWNSSGSSGGRAAAFFASFAFALATVGTNISANSLSAANDMTVLCPKYINIRRGQVICALIGGWAACPWEILNEAQGFLSFMSGYTVFLGPFAGIMVTDYWIIHKCKVDVRAMYDPQGRYRYWNGINWRAVVALLFSVTPSLPGLAASINPSLGVNLGDIKHLFDIAWLYGFFTAAALYWALSVLFPPRETFVTSGELEDLDSKDETSSDGVGKDEKDLVV
ncbi:hypothetical protein VNI00_009069 [Paramarasmius palmivorus]|uniref:NCS1 nucleoside transporter family n=1 Tax=Paramarasmius palmivorus TaxID=297713 RepID=A0AAW0CRE6_9AGAR